jgi:tryptophan halogenase
MGGISLGGMVETLKKQLLIVGGGTAGWMAAGYFSQKGYPVTLIESDQVPIVGVGESTLPAMNAFAQELGMTESEWMPLADATFKLGIRHLHWNSQDSEWWHWFLYDRTKEPEQHQHLENNTLPPRQELKYAYHVNAHKFGDTIAKVVALKNGTKHVVAHIDHVIGDPESGIKQIVTRDGRVFQADFYIDCTGWKKLLGRPVGKTYHRYEHLVQDRALALQGRK